MYADARCVPIVLLSSLLSLRFCAPPGTPNGDMYLFISTSLAFSIRCCVTRALCRWCGQVGWWMEVWRERAQARQREAYSFTHMYTAARIMGAENSHFPVLRIEKRNSRLFIDCMPKLGSLIPYVFYAYRRRENCLYRNYMPSDIDIFFNVHSSNYRLEPILASSLYSIVKIQLSNKF